MNENSHLVLRRTGVNLWNFLFIAAQKQNRPSSTSCRLRHGMYLDRGSMHHQYLLRMKYRSKSREGKTTPLAA